jgi:hypothetical protein
MMENFNCIFHENCALVKSFYASIYISSLISQHVMEFVGENIHIVLPHFIHHNHIFCENTNWLKFYQETVSSHFSSGNHMVEPEVKSICTMLPHCIFTRTVLVSIL